MASASKPSGANKATKPLTKEQIANEFNELRNQQRQIVSKMSEITDEKKEYQSVSLVYLFSSFQSIHAIHINITIYISSVFFNIFQFYFDFHLVSLSVLFHN